MKKVVIIIFGILSCFWVLGQPNPTCPATDPEPVDQLPPVKETFTPPTTVTPPPSPPAAPGDRIVYWVHGLGGVPENWHKVGHVTEYQSSTNNVSGYPDRKVASLFPSLGPDKANWSLDAVGTTLRTFMVTDGEAMNQANNITGVQKLNNFVIGHSQGGLSPRVLERRFVENQEERLFDGLVSFGSPHQGATILNNVGMIEQLAAEGCQALSSGPIEEGISPVLEFALKVFTSVDDIQSTVNNTCSTVGEVILPLAFNDYTADVTNDYYTGSSYINTLNQFNSTMHKIAFWGDETEEPLVWHTVSSFDPLGNLDNPNNFTVFTADDETLPEIAENARLHYQSKVAEWEANMNDLCGWCFFGGVITGIGGTIINQNEAESIAEAYQLGLEWLNWQANDGYKVVIGAKTFDNPVVTGGECWCTFTSSLPYPTSYSYFEPVPNSNACSALTNYSNTFCSWEDIISYLPKEHASDGVVLAESALGLPSATAPPQRMEDNNHMEMRNSSETKRVLNELFNTGFSDQYFKTLPRD